jgi:hypothetical protein
VSRSEDIPLQLPSVAELDASLAEFERYHAALALIRVVARARREIADSDLNRLSWRTRVDLGTALTRARVWFNVAEDDLNEH